MEAVTLPDAQPAAHASSAARRARTPWPWLAAFAFGTGFDQLTKHWAELHVRPRGIVTLVPEVLDLRYARNPGAFFSLGADLPGGLRQWLLCGASLLVLALIVALHRRTTERQRAQRWGLALLAGGATGNLIDRARGGEVVDFIHLHAGAWLHWATFNVADVAITAGLCLLGWDALRGNADPTRASARPEPALDGGGS